MNNKVSPIKIQLQEQLSDLPKTKGFFESFKGELSHNNLTIHFLSKHFCRLKTNVKNINFEFEDLISSLSKLSLKAKKNPNFSKDLRFRLWTDGTETSLIASNLNQRFKSTDGVELKTYLGSRELQGKYTPATESIASILSAKSDDFDESLLINKDNLITETSWANFLYIVDNKIHTTGFGLNGITQSVIFEFLLNQFTYPIRKITLNELLSSQYPCFISNSIFGIIPIKRINDINFKSSPLIDKLIVDYLHLEQSKTQTIWIPINS